MKGQTGNILYIGKSKSIKNRVRSYFTPPVHLESKTARLVSQVAKIDYIEVSSDLESLLLESRLIKKFRPHYNIASKDDKSPYYVHLTREDYPRPVINHDSRHALAGPFLNHHVPTKILKLLRQISPFCLSPRPVKRPCLYSHLGLCRPCPANGNKLGYLKNITILKKLLSGQFSPIKKDLSLRMLTASKNQDFETASLLRDQLHHLNLLLATPIPPDFYISNPNLISDQRQEAVTALQNALVGAINKSPLHRIEFFDNAHLSGTSPTSGMTVAIAGQVTPSQYRHFTLKSSSDDVSMMKEVLERRLKHSDWPKPDLIALDGGIPQLSIAHWNTPTIALAKKREIIYTQNGTQIKLEKNHPGLKLLMHLRDEAHRFSRALHFKHRAQKMLN